jgi:hypothetical protein
MLIGQEEALKQQDLDLKVVVIMNIICNTVALILIAQLVIAILARGRVEREAWLIAVAL